MIRTSATDPRGYRSATARRTPLSDLDPGLTEVRGPVSGGGDAVGGREFGAGCGSELGAARSIRIVPARGCAAEPQGSVEAVQAPEQVRPEGGGVRPRHVLQVLQDQRAADGGETAAVVAEEGREVQKMDARRSHILSRSSL